MWAYRALRLLLEIVVGVFYRQIEVVGQEHIPSSGPVIFRRKPPELSDRPGIDRHDMRPRRTLRGQGRALSQPTAFHFLRGLGAVPIRRRADHGGGTVDNSPAFESMFHVLATGRGIGIFPEGISHNAAHLKQMRTGAARVAMGTLEGNPDLKIKIVPCGLSYVHRRHFRSRVLVQYGEPIIVDSTRLDGPEEESAEHTDITREITDEIDEGLRALTVNASDWETLRVLDGVRRLYQPPKIPLQHRIELARRFALVYQEVRDEPAVVELYANVRDYLDRLRDLGLSDASLRQPVSPAAFTAKVIWQLTWLLLWLPLAAPGLVIHAPVGVLAAWGGMRFTPRKDVIGTTKLIVGLMLVMLCYTAVAAAAGLLFGWAGLIGTLSLLLLSGFATIRVLDRSASLQRIIARVFRTFILHKEVESLRALRRELEAAVVQAVERYRPEDMEPLYPR